MSDTVTSQTGPWAMVPLWVLRVGLSGAELAVYVSLRGWADRSGAAHPRVKLIAERAGVSERTAERAITRLRDLGLLTTTRRYRDDRSIAGCNYTLRDLPLDTMAAGTDADDARGTDEDDGTPPTRMTEQEHTTEHTSLEHIGSTAGSSSGDISGSSSGPTQSAPSKRRRKPIRHENRPLTKADQADYAALADLCRENDLDDPVSVWWTLRKEHNAAKPSRVMADLIDKGQWTGFVGNNGIVDYLSNGEVA